MVENKRIHLLGSVLDVLSMEETLSRVEELIEAGQPSQHVVINASKINLMAENEELQKIVNASPLVNADGQSVVWAAQFLGYDVKERVTGIDLFENLVAKAAEKGWKPYYFGATEEAVREVVRIHQEKYPSLKVAGFRNGYFEDVESEQIAHEIKESQADIVFVAFSSPKKEVWVNAHKELMQVPFVMGVGGSFDVIAGKTKRAPKWMQKTGLEWFYRLVQEPRRMFKRYAVGNFRFVKHVLTAKRNQKRSE
ncbi:beta-1,4-N-acetyl-mannosaminyltransferase [Listeria floridensis FSL S10-1187]|uniref:Beta-1,4-N-acetyl-mannosaminyltransferase n=1 Tax=Listeria floridensis FSL S10-1187 TaxID=1265817 RepID=A0ABN0REC2_9LIST|nr:WecB/TagA/CpsF family glycosyltransferase [Listeria floridensis]EUJ30948.1 beta-1,4-N-acetyl-mannosaminyltransferase [Listeria floridensis FSL S10-1187]